MVNKFLLFEGSVYDSYRIDFNLQRNLSAIKNFFVFMIMQTEYKVNRDTLCNITYILAIKNT